MRRDIPGLFGATFNEGSWNAGMVLIGKNLVLLMTLKKGNLAAGNQYEDHFIDPQTFQWHTQSKTTQRSKHGQVIGGGLADYRVHLFIRPSKLRDTGAAPFTYCGEISFAEWAGEKPITVTSKLGSPVPDHLRRVFRIGQGAA